MYQLNFAETEITTNRKKWTDREKLK